MRAIAAQITGAVALAVFAVSGSGLAQERLPQKAASDAPPPPWAYPVRSGGGDRPEDDGTPKRVPGSTVELTLMQIRDIFNPPDWHPDRHPPMPEVVAHGRRPDVFACGYCHYPNGQGRPENAGIAGLPAQYIMQQVADFRSGARTSSEPEMGPPRAMIRVAKAVADEDLRAAADYFAGLEFQPWIQVVESDSVPRTRVQGMLVPLEEGGTEPLGQRIIEVPRDVSRTALRDAASGFVAYVPPGSLRKGEDLVTTGGGGRTVACATCHGPDLKGLGYVPGIAGRSPTYLVRQLFDFQSGARNGPWAVLMKEPVDRLTVEDMVSIAAYVASLEP